MGYLLLSSLALALCAQEPIPLVAPIQRVRLHPDEAWVTRVGKVHLPGAGTHRILIKDLPQNLKVEDLQASVRGAAGLRLGDLSVTSDVRVVEETPEWKKLNAEREALREKRDDLESQGEAAQQELAFLKGLQAAHDKELSTRLAYTTPSAVAVVELSKGMQTRMAELLTAERRRKRDLEKLSQEEGRVKAEITQRSGEKREAPSRATLEITTNQQGEAEIELGYRTRAARWRPLYEARLSEDRKKMDVVLYASVSQNTGENWTGVRMEISNARPSRDLSLASYSAPRMLAWTSQPFVQTYAPLADKVSVNYCAEQAFQLPVGTTFSGAMSLTPGIAGYSSDAQVRGSAGNQIMYRIDGINVKDDGGPSRSNYQSSAPPPQPVIQQGIEATASLLDEASGLTRTFLVDGLKDVPFDNQPHRFKVLVKEVEPKLVVFAAPRLDSNAFLLARFPAPEGLPLFPGSPVMRFAGNQRLGEAPLAIPAAGQPFSLGFGPYKSVRVALRRVDQKLETVGSFTKERQWTLTERLELDNDGGEALDMEIQDRILKSGTDQVKVTILPGYASGYTEKVPGVRTWTFTVAPKEHKALELPVSIRAPREGAVTGAEGLGLMQ